MPDKRARSFRKPSGVLGEPDHAGEVKRRIGMQNGWRAVLSVAMLLALARLIAQTISPSRGWAIALHGGAGKGEWEHMNAATAAAL
jgi:hypothetical protein